MNTGRTKAPLINFIEVNPRETIDKGHLSKKIGMDKLQPFCRDIQEYEIAEFNGGAKFRNSDTIMARITPCLENGKIAMVNVLDENEVGFGSTEYIVFRAKKGLTIPDFVYYLVSSSIVRNPAIKSMVGSSGRQRVQIDVVKNIEICFPSISEQFKIASILKALDDKIALNNKINNNLAEQSQAIFAEFMCKYPYVLSPLGDMAEIIDCLHSKKPKAVNGTTYQLLQLNNITDSGFLDLSSKYYISKSDYENWTRKCEIVEGDCVITNVGRIGAVSQAPNGTHAAMGRNMTCIRLRNDKPFYSYLITALLSPHIRREIMKNTDEGTIMGALNVKNIPLLLFPMFALPTMNALEDLLSPIRKAIEQNYLSNQMLSLLRDSLLPRLMSGELDVSNIEI